MFKRLSKSLILVVAVLAFSGYEAYACFVQGKEPFWDNFTHKKMDLEIDFAGYYNKAVDGHPNAGYWKPRDLSCQDFFNFDDIKPGDWGEGTISLHLKNQDAWGCAIIRPTKNDDRSSNEPELLVDQPDLHGDKWDGELAQHLNFEIWADICKISPAKLGDNIFQPDCDRLLTSGTGPLDSIKLPLADSANPNVFTETMGPLKKDKTYYIGAKWSVPEDTGNIIQTDTYKADIAFFAEQSDGNSNFRCADIRDENPEKCVNGISRDCYNGSSGTKDIGICRSGTETCTRGDWEKCVGEILPEEEICADAIDNDCNGKVDEQGCVAPPCKKDSQCSDGNVKTDDKCVKGECEHKIIKTWKH
jgi:hypothetical protein